MPLIENLYLYVIDGSQGFLDNPTDWLDCMFTINEIEVTSVADMVTKIEGRLGSERRIQNLFIGGHGLPGYQSVGAGNGWDGTGAHSLQVDPTDPTRLRGSAHQSMLRLAGRFSKGAQVTLGGCQVAKDTSLLQVLSTVLSEVPVQAGKDNQRPFLPGMEGNVIRCKGATCTDLGGGSWWASPGSWFQ